MTQGNKSTFYYIVVNFPVCALHVTHNIIYVVG